MSPAITFLCVFLCVSALVLALGTAIYDRFIRYRVELAERLEGRFGPPQAVEGESAIFHDRRALFEGGARRSVVTTVSEWIAQSGDKVDLARLVAWSVALACAAGAIAFWASPSPLWAIPAGALAAAAPWAFVEIRRQRRVALLRRQLPDAFDALGRAVRSGHTIQSALRNVAEEFDGPIAEEFGCCYGQQDLGMSSETSWRALAARTQIMELRIFVVGMLVQGRSGGNLVELLDGLAEMSRKRLRLQMKIKAVTGEGRMQAVVLMLLPPAAFVTILALAPDYAKTLLDRRWLLALTAGAQIVGAIWIRQIIRVNF